MINLLKGNYEVKYEYDSQLLKYLHENNSKNELDFIQEQTSFFLEKQKEYEKELKELSKKTIENQFFDVIKKYSESERRRFIENRYNVKKENLEGFINFNNHWLKFFEIRKNRLPQEPNKIDLKKNKKPSVPFQIALLNELGFFELPRVKSMSKTNQYKLISKLLGTQERTVKGNYSTLQDRSNEDLAKYTSHVHIENVRKIILNLS